MKIKILGGLLVAMLAITSIAEAQTTAPVVKHRHQLHQRHERRIANDVRDGKLNGRQAAHLQHAERRIAMQKHRMKEQGRYTVAERRQLRHEEKRVGHAIRRDERNDKVS
jgi:hypothetical protein